MQRLSTVYDRFHHVQVRNKSESLALYRLVLHVCIETINLFKFYDLLYINLFWVFKIRPAVGARLVY